MILETDDKSLRRGDEHHIQRDLTRKRELEEVLRRFHEAAGFHPDMWKDENAVREALGAASELQAVEHELCLLYLQQMKRDTARRVSQARQRELHGAEEVSPAPTDPERILRARAFEAQQSFDHAIDRLRFLTGGEASHLADRERQARLRWLLTLLAEILPEAAHEIEVAWTRLRGEQSGGRSTGLNLARWERQTGDWLVRFLEPLLPV